MNEQSSSERLEAKRERIKYAIEKSAASQGVIADHCCVTRQSVTNWKSNGLISSEHLLKLSSVTGFSYWWLLQGQGPMRGEVQAEGMPAHQSELSSDITSLLKAIEYAVANGKLKPEGIQALTIFFRALVGD